LDSVSTQQKGESTQDDGESVLQDRTDSEDNLELDPANYRLEDGHGSVWYKCDYPKCDLEIVRPGKVQCSQYCDDAQNNKPEAIEPDKDNKSGAINPDDAQQSPSEEAAEVFRDKYHQALDSDDSQQKQDDPHGIYDPRPGHD